MGFGGGHIYSDYNGCGWGRVLEKKKKHEVVSWKGTMSQLWTYSRNAVYVCQVTSVVSNSATLWTVAHQDPLWDFPSKNTGPGSHFLLQGIFPMQGSNPHLLHHLLHCRRILNL